MMKYFSFFLLLIPFVLFADVNDDFINNEMKNIDKLTKNAEFFDGEIYFEDDTINDLPFLVDTYNESIN